MPVETAMVMKKSLSKVVFSCIFAAALAIAATGCDAFRSLRNSDGMTAQGRPYELVIVCNHNAWNGMLGDSLRAVFTTPVPYLNQTEPVYDIVRVTERGYTGTVARHRNILKTVIDPTLPQAETVVQYDLTAQPQIIVTLQGPTEQSLTDYLSAHRNEMVQVFELAERDRSIRFTERYFAAEVSKAIEERFGVQMKVRAGTSLQRRSPTSYGHATNIRKPVRDFLSIRIPTKGPNRFRRRLCSQHATSSRHASRARPTVRT